MAESSNNEEKMNSDKLRNSLRKMIKSFDSYIKEAKNFEQLEDNLKHMEETDENFHKYDLVEILSDRIETLLGASIEKHVNDTFTSNKFDGDIGVQNKMAQNIFDDIIKTKEFSEFKSSFKQGIFKANETLVKNFHNNFIESNSEEVTIHDNESKSITFTNDFDMNFSSLDNSLNQNSFVFFTSEQFPVIAQNLDPKKSEQVRLRAIKQLLSIPASDPQAADHWVDIRKFLNYSLKDPSEVIADLCLKLHSRTLASSHHKVSLEIYINLVEHLSEYFKDKELEKRSFKANIDLNSTENVFLFKFFRLINDYAKDITNKWARYPESFIESIIDETLKLFIVVSEQKSINFITPLHYISLIDIQSLWFAKWMHGHDSRKVLINSIKKHEAFLQTSIGSIIAYLTSNIKRVGESGNNSNFSQNSNGNRKKSNSFISTNSNNNPSKRTVFRKIEVEYSFFVHSLNVIRKILCFKNGRRLFPIKVLNNKEVSIKDLIKTIIQIIFETAAFKTANEFSPSKYAYDFLQDLCESENTCEACLCNEEVIEHLIKPLKTIMNSKKNGSQNISSSSNINSMGGFSSSSGTYYDESCLLIVANVLSKLASTQCGYRQLIFNDSKKNFSSAPMKNSAAYTIVSFVKKALTNQLNYNISTGEIAEYLYLARLLYSQVEGVYLIKEYELNKSISESWRLISNYASSSSSSTNPNTPRQMAPTFSITLKEMFTFSWSESLLDNLVSMGSTPKGVFYLNETGLLRQVVNYMFTRYKSKLQVGKYEKFGYGFIVSQLSNTPSGCFYLNEASLIQYLIDEIWTELEYGSDDFMSAFPRSYSVEIIDKEIYKPMLCLMNILSSFSAVYELLADVTITPRSNYGVRDMPKGLIGLLDRVAFLDRKTKISSLCNYEQSHIFGIRLLSFLQSDLDVLLLLESQYNITSLLFALQRTNRSIKADYDYSNPDEVINNDTDNLTESENEPYNLPKYLDNSPIIVDLLSVERNFVLVNSNLIGGPREKIIPTRNFNENKNYSFNYQLFDSLPVPASYYKTDEFYDNQAEDKAFNDFILGFNYDKVTKNDEIISKWLKSLKSFYFSSLKECRSIHIGTIVHMFDQIVSVSLKHHDSSLFSINSEYKNLSDFMNKSVNLIPAINITKLQLLGIEKTLDYGIQINLLKRTQRDEYKNSLTQLHKLVKTLFKSCNTNKKFQQKQENFLNYSQEDSYPNYDWFSSTIFLLNEGNLNSSIKFLYNFYNLQLSAFLWSVRLYSNETLLSNVYNKNGISILISTTCHYVEHILKIELPLVFSAFRMSGLAPSQICSHWLKQCFWNYLDWPDIITYLSLCLVFGADYQTYFCVAILKHLNLKNDLNDINQKIIQHHTYKDLQIYLKENHIENFKIEHHMDFMHGLELKYRQYIFQDIKETFAK